MGCDVYEEDLKAVEECVAFDHTMDIRLFLDNAVTSPISGITKHLSERGFATRREWIRDDAIPFCFFGADNVMHSVLVKSGKVEQGSFKFCIKDFIEEDWIAIPYFYRGQGVIKDIAKKYSFAM